VLLLGRKVGESIWMPHLNIEIRVVEIRHNSVRLGINAPREIAVVRDDAVDTRGIDLQLFTGATDGTDTDTL
jgi:carbon storage regulator CsrA